jgi:ABC-2 type transport system permease protein
MIGPAMLIVALVAVLFTSLGVAIASVLEDMQGFQLIMNFLVMPIVFLSGAFFPLQGLPGVMEIVVKIDPLTYGVDALRGALIGVYQFGLGTDLAILGAITAVILGIGTWLFSKIEA